MEKWTEWNGMTDGMEWNGRTGMETGIGGRNARY